MCFCVAFACRKEWKQLLALCDCSLGAKLPADRFTLAVAYNKAVAAFHVLGGGHPDAQAAVAAALDLDRWAWCMRSLQFTCQLAHQELPAQRLCSLR
jgi:hypothetical protein